MYPGVLEVLSNLDLRCEWAKRRKFNSKINLIALLKVFLVVEENIKKN